jgi:hypothetical protein
MENLDVGDKPLQVVFILRDKFTQLNTVILMACSIKFSTWVWRLLMSLSDREKSLVIGTPLRK